MQRILRDILIWIWKNGKRLNDNNILLLLEPDPVARLLDAGCGDGEWTLKVADSVGTVNICGVDIVNELVLEAKKKGVAAKRADLNKKFPFNDCFFDVVHSNQVIEHISDVDNYIGEIYRILKPDGYAIFSTENLSAADNLIALFLGQQAFSQRISEKYWVGNIFSPHHRQKREQKGPAHKIIFTYFGLQQLLNVYNFRVERVLTAGFFPLPNFLSKLDPVHAHFIAIKARKRAGEL